jgi:3-hydroxyacyl-CoA dehydrogenase
MNFANAGIPVTVVEMAKDALDRGLGIVRKNYEATASRGRLTAADVEKRMGLITGTTDFNAIKDADIVIEAVFEEMPIKKEVFAKLGRHRQAGRRAGHEHLHARRQRDRLGHQAAGERDRHALLQPRPT